MNHQNKYKVNLHAHTVFSDGANSPLVMALAAKKAGLESLIITDHVYSKSVPTDWGVLTRFQYPVLRRLAREAAEILPVIVGIELAIENEEILIFGSAVIQEVLADPSKITVGVLADLKQKYDCACVLCHPGTPENWKKLLPILDGYEQYNSNQDWFNFRDGRTRDKGVLEGLPYWCNSDAHNSIDLATGSYNLVDSKITTECDLIKYLKRKKQPTPVLVNGDERRSKKVAELEARATKPLEEQLMEEI